MQEETQDRITKLWWLSPFWFPFTATCDIHEPNTSLTNTKSWSIKANTRHHSSQIWWKEKCELTPSKRKRKSRESERNSVMRPSAKSGLMQLFLMVGTSAKQTLVIHLNVFACEETQTKICQPWQPKISARKFSFCSKKHLLLLNKLTSAVSK